MRPQDCDYADPKKADQEPETVRPEWEDQRIRIEALRAAAQVVAAQHGNASPEPAYPKATLDVAGMFAQWLETGE